MKTSTLNYFRLISPLFFLFFLITGLQAQDHPFTISIENEEGQFITQTTIRVQFMDGSKERCEINGLGSEKKTSWAKTFQKEVKQLEFQVNIHTSYLFDPLKTIYKGSVEPLNTWTSYKLTLKGSYQRPYVGKSHQTRKRA